MHKLKINENPPVKTYQNNAYVESILHYHKDYQYWLMNNYVQLVFSYTGLGEKPVLEYFGGNIFGSCPLLKNNYIKKEKTFKTNFRTHLALQFLIRHHYYIYTFCDEYYIPSRNAYQNYHLDHDILIYGYNSYKKIYNIIGYDKSKYYKAETISFQQIENAIKTKNPTTFKIKLKKKRYHFNIQNFKHELSDYLYCNDSRQTLDLYYDKSTYNPGAFDSKLSSELHFGLDVYDQLIVLFNNMNDTIDIRLLYIIYEHKCNMLNKLYFLYSNHYLSQITDLEPSFKLLVKKSQSLMLLGIKFNIMMTEKIINKMNILLTEIKNIDYNACSMLFERL